MASQSLCEIVKYRHSDFHRALRLPESLCFGPRRHQVSHFVAKMPHIDEKTLRVLQPYHAESDVVHRSASWYPREAWGRASQEFALESEEGEFRDLVGRIRNKDPQAARELVLRYEGAIRRVVRIHMRDRRMRQLLDSTDVCQSVLASFFVRTALGQYELDTPAQLINLLTTIARNKLTNQVHAMRAQKRDIGRSVTIEAESVVLVDRASSPSEQASAKEILQKAYEHLSPEERSLAEQRSLGRPWTELAEEFGATDVALRKRLTRALDRVLTELGIDDTDDQ
jgi:RNA polymerase sigma factor (sigma-70 family)